MAYTDHWVSNFFHAQNNILFHFSQWDAMQTHNVENILTLFLCYMHENRPLNERTKQDCFSCPSIEQLTAVINIVLKERFSL